MLINNSRFVGSFPIGTVITILPSNGSARPSAVYGLCGSTGHSIVASFGTVTRQPLQPNHSPVSADDSFSFSSVSLPPLPEAVSHFRPFRGTNVRCASTGSSDFDCK